MPVATAGAKSGITQTGHCPSAAEQACWSWQRSGERVSQSLLTSRPDCREEAGPRSHQEATIRLSKVKDQAWHADSTAHARASRDQGRASMRVPSQGPEGAWGKAADEPSHSFSSQGSSLL